MPCAIIATRTQQTTHQREWGYTVDGGTEYTPTWITNMRMVVATYDTVTSHPIHSYIDNTRSGRHTPTT